MKPIPSSTPTPPSPESLSEAAIPLAAELLRDSLAALTPSERRQARSMARMMDDPMGKTLTLALTDQIFRPLNPQRAASQYRHLLEEYGVPSYLSLPERAAMQAGSAASRLLPELVMPAVTAKVRQDSRKVILPAENEQLEPLLAKHRERGTRLNINQLGEAVLGEEEAKRRLELNLERLRHPDCAYISVKISAIFSQINLVAYQWSLENVKDRLRELYRCAAEHPYEDENGRKSPKFVNLDMEEYRDLHLTCDAFREVLMEPEFLTHSAGIVLQAYLPDSFKKQQELTDWARQRVAQGGAPVKLRIVKGANLAMEEVEASLHDWPPAPYGSKSEVDANFKRMLHYGCQPENARVMRLGVASHNLFEIAHALVLRRELGVADFVEFEMLEGMANHQARTVQDRAGGLLRYAPVVHREDFPSAISYLVRRLDENTQSGNFLRDLFGMSPGDPRWEAQKNAYLHSLTLIDKISSSPRRQQCRAGETYQAPAPGHFRNAPDSDWTRRANQEWIAALTSDARAREINPIPLQIAGEFHEAREKASGRDPSTNKTFYQYALANEYDVDQALATAATAQKSWAGRPVSERAELLRAAAARIASQRGETIALMSRDAAKAVPEGDAEVSEAIDFANYYAESLSWPGLYDGTTLEPLGTVVVTPPWNFPYAIPCGGLLAALMAGNAVILKPAPETVLTAWHLVNQLWEAGFPRELVQFLPCPDDHVGTRLVANEKTAAVVLTGAYDTGMLFQSWKPEMRLFAETSGKNALVIT
ncbi:MAG: proline dehydrogenase family protein, partial [Verrucomicrobiales bacterium]